MWSQEPLPLVDGIVLGGGCSADSHWHGLPSPTLAQEEAGALGNARRQRGQAATDNTLPALGLVLQEGAPRTEHRAVRPSPAALVAQSDHQHSAH